MLKFLDILQFFNRDELELMQSTNRIVNYIVDKEFAEGPYRVISIGLVLKPDNKELLISLSGNNGCFVPDIRGWQPDSQDLNNPCNHYYSVDKMRPYLLGSVRIRNFGINITKIPYTCADIATLESISHIWARQSMCLWISNEAQESIQKIFRSHSILKCRELLIDSEHVDVKFYQYSSVYNLEAVYYNRLIKNDDLVDIIMNKAVYPESNTIIDLLALRDTDVLEAIEETRNRFLESPVSFCFRIAIHVILPVEDPGQLAFETRNERTKKMLKLEYVTGEEANERFGMSLFPNPALIFEQVPI